MLVCKDNVKMYLYIYSIVYILYHKMLSVSFNDVMR